MSPINGLSMVLIVSSVWLIACALILFASLSGRWGKSHRLIPWMAGILAVGFIAYLVLAYTDDAEIMEIAYMVTDCTGYIFVFLSLLLVISYSRKPWGIDPVYYKLLCTVAAAIVVLVLINPFNGYIQYFVIENAGYSYLRPVLGDLAAIPLMFSLICVLFTIILPFHAFTEARGRYYETLTLLSAGGFVLLLSSFYLNFDIIDGDPILASISLYTVFLIIAYLSSLRLNNYIYEPDIKELALDSMLDPVIAVDCDGRLVYANEVAERLLKNYFEHINGNHIDEYIPWNNLERMGLENDPDTVKLSDGTAEKTYRVNRFPLIERDGAQKGTAYLLRDISDLAQYLKAVAVALEKLELLDSITRHDILNYITIIQGYTEIARMTDDEEKRDGYFQKILNGCQKVEDVIDFNRSYSGLGKTLEWTSLRKSLEKSVEEAGNDSEIQITIHDAPDVKVYVDALFNRALYNIINNCLCHAKGAKRVDILMGWYSDDEYRIIIEDDGCGIPQEEKELIFRNGYGKAHGFGLFLTKEILEISQAKIWEEGDKGARFVISFPRSHVRMV